MTALTKSPLPHVRTEADVRAAALLDELWIARAQHLSKAHGGCGALVAAGGVRVSEGVARSVTNAVREAARAGKRTVRGATLYLDVGRAELDRGELHAIASAGVGRVVLAAGTASAALAARLAAHGIDVRTA